MPAEQACHRNARTIVADREGGTRVEKPDLGQAVERHGDQARPAMGDTPVRDLRENPLHRALERRKCSRGIAPAEGAPAAEQEAVVNAPEPAHHAAGLAVAAPAWD